MKRSLLLIFILPFLLNVTGCVFLLGGAAGALGAYGISKDTVQGETDRTYDSLWNAALIVSRIRGSIKQEDKQKGYLELETESSYVWIRLIRLSRATTRLRISARKYHLPNLGLAQDVFVKIIEEAR